MRENVFIIPRCERCDKPIYDLRVETSNFEKIGGLALAKRIEPSFCPNCSMIIGKIEVNTTKKTAIVKER